MDHARIDEDQLAQRYLMGKLDAESRHRFEEHFVDCPACLETLETFESLRTALKELPPGIPAAMATAPGRPWPAWALLAAACVLMSAAGSLYFYGEARRARRELEAARQASEKAGLHEAELAPSNGKRPAIPPASMSDAGREALAAAPLAAVVFTLNRTRGVSVEPDDRIALPSAGWVVLLFDRPDRSAPRGYRVQVSTAAGRPVGEPVTASAASGGMLAVGLPSSLLAAGDYALAVQDAGSGAALAAYRFRVVANR
jgi:hypothetical protein